MEFLISFFAGMSGFAGSYAMQLLGVFGAFVGILGIVAIYGIKNPAPNSSPLSLVSITLHREASDPAQFADAPPRENATAHYLLLLCVMCCGARSADVLAFGAVLQRRIPCGRVVLRPVPIRGEHDLIVSRLRESPLGQQPPAVPRTGGKAGRKSSGRHHAHH